MPNKKWTKELQAKIIARAWKDETFKKLLLKNPKAALKEYGVEIPSDCTLTALSEDTTHAYIILPQCPTNLNKLSEAELEALAAASNTARSCSVCCFG